LQTQRIAAAREAAGTSFVINARIDIYLLQIGDPEDRFEETVRRARAYRAAGADCIFVPGVVDAPTIGSLVREIHAPLNVMAGPGAPNVAELKELGVARVSVGPAIALVALGATQRAAQTLLQDGTYDGFVDALPFPDVNGAFKRS
jgi:2-methylisocitrate lyase-like PEP mutase family enzyme